mmetsp:Transcript_10739/g.19319  ORF Transcript_10739/g.19319 Transcript_10739/m.19319 type:complete len:169 (+) Transcript_10739:301-807(+)
MSSLPTGRGHDKMEYYEAKFGAAMVRGMIPQMKATAMEHGIEMNYGGYVGNTFDSHRLIWKAREEGGSELQDKVVEQIFQAYFTENKSLGERTVLEECASKAGLAQSSIDFLSDSNNNSDGTREVRDEMQDYGRAFQCTGVPMFIVDGKHTLSGAQESDSFLRLFGKL